MQCLVSLQSKYRQMYIHTVTGSILSIWFLAWGKHLPNVLLSERLIPRAHVKKAPASCVWVNQLTIFLPFAQLLQWTQRRGGCKVILKEEWKRTFPTGILRFCFLEGASSNGRRRPRNSGLARGPGKLQLHTHLGIFCTCSFVCLDVSFHPCPLFFMFPLRHLFLQEAFSDIDWCTFTALSSPGACRIAWCSHVPCASASFCSAMVWVPLLPSHLSTYHRSWHPERDPWGSVEGESVLHI